MKEISLGAIQGVEGGDLIYTDDGILGKIDVKKSAEYWWKIYHRNSILDFLLQKKCRNKYAGSKCFNISEPYIRLYIDGDEIIFKEKFPEDLNLFYQHKI